MPVADYTNPENNATNHEPGSEQTDVTAVKEQAVDEYVPSIDSDTENTDKYVTNETINEKNATDAEAKQHFEEEKQTNNDETADADSNGMEDLSVSDWGFEE